MANKKYELNLIININTKLINPITLTTPLLLVYLFFFGPTSFSFSVSNRQFYKLKMVRFAEFYRDNFRFVEHISFNHYLDIYFNNLQRDERFTSLKNLGDVASW